MFLRPILAPALLGAACACTTIDMNNHVDGWPQLRVVVHYVSDDAMRARCSKYVAFGMLPEACSEFDFDHGDCHVWFSRDYPPPEYVVRHERLHCAGYDHPGENTMREILARYREAKKEEAEKETARGAAAAAKPPQS